MLLTRKQGGSGGGGYFWEEDGDTVEVKKPRNHRAATSKTVSE